MNNIIDANDTDTSLLVLRRILELNTTSSNVVNLIRVLCNEVDEACGRIKNLESRVYALEQELRHAYR